MRATMAALLILSSTIAFADDAPVDTAAPIYPPPPVLMQEIGQDRGVATPAPTPTPSQ